MRYDDSRRYGCNNVIYAFVFLYDSSNYVSVMLCYVTCPIQNLCYVSNHVKDLGYVSNDVKDLGYVSNHVDKLMICFKLCWKAYVMYQVMLRKLTF